MKVELIFGGMAPHIREQLSAHGINLTGNAADHFQRDAEAITRLAVRGLLADSRVNEARRKLLKNIICAASTRRNAK